MSRIARISGNHDLRFALAAIISYISPNSVGAFCVRVKVASNHFSTELTRTHQNPYDNTPFTSEQTINQKRTFKKKGLNEPPKSKPRPQTGYKFPSLVIYAFNYMTEISKLFTIFL